MSGFAVVCWHVARGVEPLRLALRGELTEPCDSGWRFLCGVACPDERSAKLVQLWGLGEVLALEPSLEAAVHAWADRRGSVRLVREGAGTPWLEVPPDAPP